MRKYNAICLWLVFAFGIHCAAAQKNQLSFSTGLVLDINTLQWSIAGNSYGQGPNVLSELIFRNIVSLGSYANITYKPLRSLELYSLYQKRSVVSGRGSDVDYRDDNRKNPTYDESFLSNKGSIKTLNTGTNIYLINKKFFHLDGGVSYTCTNQNFYILSQDTDDLKSTYEAKWKGVSFSFGGTYSISGKISVDGKLYYCFLNYNTIGNWNLRDEFMHPISFKQYAKANRFGCFIEINYLINKALVLSINGTLGKAKAFKGIDTSFLKNSEEVLTQFNEANNTSHALKIGICVSLFNKLNKA